MNGARRWTSWRVGLWAVLLVNMLGLHFLIRWEEMRIAQENTDTRVIYGSITRGRGIENWFVKDWPLKNEFYRPLPSYSFAADARLWGDNFRLYKIQNWLFATSCAFLVVWFAFELSLSRSIALASGLLFSLWQTDLIRFVPVGLCLLLPALGCLIFGVLRDRDRLPRYLLLATCLAYASLEVVLPPGANDMWFKTFGYRAMGWPPGRTATMMCLFSLVCLASYLHWERTNDGTPSQRPIFWLGLSALGFVGAACSYEQFVVLAPCLICCGLYLRLQGLRPRWTVLVVPVLLTGAYCYLHLRYLPMNTRYQHEHHRGHLTAGLDAGSWIFRQTDEVRTLLSSLDPTNFVASLVTYDLWDILTVIGLSIAGFAALGKRWKLGLASLLLSAVAFAPMAFEKPLAHYTYFPSALRMVFVITLVIGCWDMATDLGLPRRRFRFAYGHSAGTDSDALAKATEPQTPSRT